MVIKIIDAYLGCADCGTREYIMRGEREDGSEIFICNDCQDRREQDGEE